MRIDTKLLEQRLANWGRWNRDPKRQGRSPLCVIIESNPENLSREEPGEPIDVRDALQVQRAWERLPMAPERYRQARVVLGVVYAYPLPFVDLRYILRKYHRISIRDRDFEPLLELGRKMIRNNLEKMDRKS